MKKKQPNYPEYVQAYVPDTEDLAGLVAKAKGPDRSMAEFSRVCKVKGPSTFSRIVNELIDKPVSDELLYAIAKNAADPNEVTLDMLMRANGKIPKGEFAEGTPSNDSRKAYKTQAAMIRKIKDIIVQSFLDKGEAVMLHPDLMLSQLIPESKFGLSILSDFAIHIQGKEPLYWNFIVDFTDMSWVSEKSSVITDKIKRERISESMKRYAPLFLIDTWEPEILKDFENTFVFTEKKAYKAFSEMMKEMNLNTKMSVMYVGSENNKDIRHREREKV